MSKAILQSKEVVGTVGSGITTGRRGVASAFAGGPKPTAAIQVAARLADERGRIITSGVSRPRVQQILGTVLQLDWFSPIPTRHLHLDVHRPDDGRYRNQFGLALAVAMISALSRKPVPEAHLFLGDLDLHGQVIDVGAKLVDSLNEAIAEYTIETPLKIVLARESATWVNASSTVKVLPVKTLVDVVAAVWPGVNLQPW